MQHLFAFVGVHFFWPPFTGQNKGCIKLSGEFQILYQNSNLLIDILDSICYNP